MAGARVANPKYYTTKIEPEQTCSEIARLVRQVGGSSFIQNWDQQGYLGSISFVLRTEHGDLPISFRARAHQIQAELDCDWDRALRVAWRQQKHLIEGMIMSIESGVTDAHTVFLGYVATPDGFTLGERLQLHGANQFLLETEVVEGEFVDG